MPYPYFNNYQQNFSQYPQYQQMPQLNSFQNGNSSPMPQMPQQLTQMPAATIQAGFVRVQSEDEAKRYSVAPGGSVTFIDDNAPYCYVKTAGLSQLDPPTFKRYRLVEEDERSAQNTQSGDINDISKSNIDLSIYAKIADIDALKCEIDDINALIEKMRFDIGTMQEKSTKKFVQRARRDADEDE